MQRRQAVGWLREAKATSERQACRVVGQARTTQRRHAVDRRRHDGLVEMRLLALARKHRAWGCGQLHDQLRLEGHWINHKRTARLYREHGLALRRRRRRKLPVEARKPLLQPIRPNLCWSLDFMGDSLADGRSYRTLNVLDDYARDALTIEIDLSLTATRVVRVLDRLCAEYGQPEAIRSDNGPELRSKVVRKWATERGIRWDFTQPGHPEQNAYIERFNGTYRREVLDASQFESIQQARQTSEVWRRIYNEQRAHSAIGHLPPKAFKQRWQQRQSLLMAGSE
ncbi:MAG: IS3 family transposase [Rhodanobacteraceae bacterium]